MYKGHLKNFAITLACLCGALFAMLPVCAAGPKVESSNVEVRCNVATSISISTPRNILDAYTGPDGETKGLLSPGLFYTGIITANVTTNDVYGYHLSMSVKTNHTSLRQSNDMSIPSVESAKTPSAFSGSVGGWGYAIGNNPTSTTEYLPLPEVNASDTSKNSQVTLKHTQTDTGASSDPNYVTIGVMPAYSSQVGKYTNTLTFTAVANEDLMKLDSIRVYQTPSKTSYQAGENFDPAGMIIEATYTDGTYTMKKFITAYTLSNNTNLQAGNQVITITYIEGGITKTTTITVAVAAAPLRSAPRNYTNTASGESATDESGHTTDSLYTAPQGVTDEYIDTKDASDGILEATIITGAATVFFILFAARRIKDDDEEE